MSVEHKITLPRQSFRILFTQIVSVQGWAVTNKDHRASSSILNNKQVEEILDAEPPETDKKEVMKDWMAKEFEITFSENERDAFKKCISKSTNDGTLPVNKYTGIIFDVLGLD